MPKISTEFEPAFVKLNDDLRELIEDAPLASLGDGPRDAKLIQWLKEVASLGDRAGSRIGTIDVIRIPELMSGLWLIAGDIEASHTISQSIENPEGSYLHGIMHRREGDFSNAKYWFRRVGKHALFERIDRVTGGGYGDGFAFCDRVEQSQRRGQGDAEALKRVQWCEIQSLMEFCV